MEQRLSDLKVETCVSDTFILVLAEPKRYRYVPKEDITIHEVAKIIPLLIYPSSIECAESDLLRHFEEVK